MSEGAAYYSGLGLSLRGEKGRLVLPSDLRKGFAEAGDERILCLSKHEKFACLSGFGLSRINAFERVLEAEERRAERLGKDFDYDTRKHQLFGFARLPFDASGRFVLPDYLSALGHIEEAVFFHGAGDYFTLWNPEELFRMDSSWATAQAACRELLDKAKRK